MIKRLATSILRLYFVALIIAVAPLGAAMAQMDSQITVPAKWETVKGSASSIAVSSNGSVAAIDTSGDVYRYIHSDTRWQRIGQNMTHISGGLGRDFWGIDTQQNLRRFTGTQWIAVGSGANDIAADDSGNIYVVTNAGRIAQYQVKAQKWQSIAGAAQKIAIGQKNMVWIITKDGKLARRLDDAWISLDVQAQDIFSDMNGRLFIIKADQKLYLWNEQTLSAQLYTGAEKFTSAAANKDQIWGISPQGVIYAQGHDTKRQNPNGEIIEHGGSGGHTEESRIVDQSPYTFELVSSSERLNDIFIGRDGSVYGLSNTGAIRRWSNGEDRFYDFPGTLKTMLIQPSGLPIGVGKNDNLLHHDGEAWRQVNLPEKLIDISLYDEERILGVNSDGRVIRVSEKRNSFTLLGTRAQKVAAHHDGSYWVIDDVNRVYSCDVDARCNQKPIQAEDIAIGPAGSVFLVDTAGQLKRYDKDADQFEIIAQNQKLSRVALGPQDRPWVINQQGKVYAANYFERDESKDRNLATKTQATKDVTTEQPNVDGNNTGVQIVQSISFNQVNVPTQASGFGTVGAGLLDITSGANDTVLAVGYGEPCSDGTGRNWVYNPVARSFNHLDYLKRANLNVLLAVDELIVGIIKGDTPPATPSPAIPSLIGEWNKTCGDQSLLLTYVASVFSNAAAQSSQNLEGAVFSSELDIGQTPDLDYSADGYVVNIAPGDELELFRPETADDVDFFDDIDFMRVGIGKDQYDIWAVSTANNVYEYVQSTHSFALRSINGDDKAQDVGVGHDGSVFIVNMSGVLKKWDAASKRFVKTNKSGVTRVAVDSRGNPIVANFPSSQTVYFGR